MNNRYRVYAIETDENESSDGVKEEWTRGCNGEQHVDHLDKVYYNAEGEVEFAEHLTTKERGPCDKSCGTERRGGFLYPSSAEVPSN